MNNPTKEVEPILVTEQDYDRLLSILRTQVELSRALRRSENLEDASRRQSGDGLPAMIAESRAMQPILRVMERIGLGGVEWWTFAYNALAHALVGVGGFLLLGGWKLFRRGAARADAADVERVEPMAVRHWVTAAGIAALIAAVVGFDLNVGLVALIVATVLVLARTGEATKAIARMPWGVFLRVTGGTVVLVLPHPEVADYYVESKAEAFA